MPEFSTQIVLKTAHSMYNFYKYTQQLLNTYTYKHTSNRCQITTKNIRVCYTAMQQQQYYYSVSIFIVTTCDLPHICVPRRHESTLCEHIMTFNKSSEIGSILYPHIEIFTYIIRCEFRFNYKYNGRPHKKINIVFNLSVWCITLLCFKV